MQLFLALTIILSVHLAAGGDAIEQREQNDKIFNYSDLLIVDGEYIVDGTIYKDEIVMCSEYGHNCTVATVITVTKIGYSHEEVTFPTKRLRAFSIKKSKSNNPLALSGKDRLKIESICEMVAPSNVQIAFTQIKTLPFGMIAHRFGPNGYFYAFNYCKEFMLYPQDFYDAFFEKYLRLEPRSLANSAIAKTVRTGDLVSIKPLTPQKNASLQIRAQHFGGSFGEMSTFRSGDLTRKNSRNQTEFAIQSLFGKREKLGLRPKYLCRITKIYVHRISDDFPFCEFRELVLSLLSNPSRNILYLPHKSPELVLMDEYAIFMLQQRKRQNLIFDVALSAVNGLHLSHKTVFEVYQQILSFPFFMTPDIWQRVIGRVRMGSHPTKMVTKMNTLFERMNAKFMKMQLDKKQNLTQIIAMTDVIQNTLSKFPIKTYSNAYVNLFYAMTEELSASIQEQHPDYIEQFCDANITLVMQLCNLYRISVIQNYLKANAKGRDLHVICYGDHRRQNLWDFRVALSEKINVEWKINNSNVSDVLTNEMIQHRQY